TDAVLAVSATVEARCRETGIAERAIHRIDGVVDAARFAAPNGEASRRVRTELGLDPGPVIGSVARLAAHRGRRLLIRALAPVLTERPGARLVLIGKGERREAIQAFVRDLGLDEQVILAGYRDGDLPAVLRALDVFALMGAGSDESCRAALEAMSAARPVIARDVGALGEVVAHGETGLVIEGDQPEAVAAALGALIRDPERARTMGQAGQRPAAALCSIERPAGRMEVLLRQVRVRRERG